MTSDELRKYSDGCRRDGYRHLQVAFESAADEIDRLTARVAELERDAISKVAVMAVLRAFYCDAKHSRDSANSDVDCAFDFHAMNCARSIAKRLGINSDLE